MKPITLTLALACALAALPACERAQHDDHAPPPPAPVTPDPIRDARAEFELLTGSAAIAGGDVLYSRGDLLGSAFTPHAFDKGDFVGRLRALFGPAPGDEYVLRHKTTGLVVTAYSGASGPEFAGAAFGDPDAKEPPAITARIAADPVLQTSPPLDDLAAVTTWNLHNADARAPAGLPKVVRRLSALIEAVPPADWDTLEYSEDANVVVRIGARRGSSFERELPPDQAMAYLLDVAARAPDDDIALASTSVLAYYSANAGDLGAFLPRVRAEWDRYARSLAHLRAAARAGDDDDSNVDELIGMAREQARALGIPSAHVAEMLARK